MAKLDGAIDLLTSGIDIEIDGVNTHFDGLEKEIASEIAKKTKNVEIYNTRSLQYSGAMIRLLSENYDTKGMLPYLLEHMASFIYQVPESLEHVENSTVNFVKLVNARYYQFSIQTFLELANRVPNVKGGFEFFDYCLNKTADYGKSLEEASNARDFIPLLGELLRGRSKERFVNSDYVLKVNQLAEYARNRYKTEERDEKLESLLYTGKVLVPYLKDMENTFFEVAENLSKERIMIDVYTLNRRKGFMHKESYDAALKKEFLEK